MGPLAGFNFLWATMSPPPLPSCEPTNEAVLFELREMHRFNASCHDEVSSLVSERIALVSEVQRLTSKLQDGYASCHDEVSSLISEHELDSEVQRLKFMLRDGFEALEAAPHLTFTYLMLLAFMGTVLLALAINSRIVKTSREHMRVSQLADRSQCLSAFRAWRRWQTFRVLDQAKTRTAQHRQCVHAILAWKSLVLSAPTIVGVEAALVKPSTPTPWPRPVVHRSTSPAEPWPETIFSDPTPYDEARLAYIGLLDEQEARANRLELEVEQLTSALHQSILHRLAKDTDDICYLKNVPDVGKHETQTPSLAPRPNSWAVLVPSTILAHTSISCSAASAFNMLTRRVSGGMPNDELQKPPPVVLQAEVSPPAPTSPHASPERAQGPGRLAMRRVVSMRV